MARDVDDSNWSQTPSEVRFCNFVTGTSRCLPTHDDFAKTTLKSLLQANSGAWIDLIGYASKLGFATGDSHQKNRDLSAARCNAVKVLVQKYSPGVRFNVIDPEGDVESAGNSKNDDGFWRAVSIRVFGVVAPSPTPPKPTASFICGPDVTEQVASTWTKMRQEFDLLPFMGKIRACNSIFLPFQKPEEDIQWPTDWTDVEKWKALARQFADINSWDTLPLFQGFSGWLRSPPVYDAKIKGPSATPSSDSLTPAPDQADNFADAHEDPRVCSNSVQVGGKCWLNGTANYGAFGIMVKACNDFASTDFRLRFTPARSIYSLEWATMLIRSYKRFGDHPEGATLPVAWTEATFRGGARAVPGIPGNRPKCECSSPLTGDVVPWDYVWDPHHPRAAAVPAWAIWKATP